MTSYQYKLCLLIGATFLIVKYDWSMWTYLFVIFLMG